MTWRGAVITAGGPTNAHAHLAKLRTILQSRLRQHGNDALGTFPVTVRRKK